MQWSSIIFNSSSFNIELENFIPFESPYSKSVILYIKINEIGDEKYIVLPQESQYHINLIGNDTGSMTYEILDYSYLNYYFFVVEKLHNYHFVNLYYQN